MKNKIGMLAGWIVFLGVLSACLITVSPAANKGTGDVRIVCMETAEDADCMLLYQEGAAVMIDSGTKQDAEQILDTLKEHQVTELDYLILSHSDTDHIGGAKEIVTNIPVRCVIQSGYAESNKEQQELNAYLEQQGIPILYPPHTERLRAGQMRLLIYPPLEKRYNDNNNYSLAVLVQHGETDMLFAGDALRKRSEELLLVDWQEIEFYKVPHHGRGNAATGALFDAVTPDYAVVTAEKADRAVIEAARRNRTELFYTGEGACVLESDGETLKIKTRKG